MKHLAMTVDQLLEAIFVLVLGVISTVVGWAISKILRNRERVIVLEERMSAMADDLVSKENIRTIIGEVLEGRQELIFLQMRQAVQEELPALREIMVRSCQFCQATDDPEPERKTGQSRRKKKAD